MVADQALRGDNSTATLGNRRTQGSGRLFARQVQRPPASGGETTASVSPRSRLRSFSQRSSSEDFVFRMTKNSTIELHQGDIVRVQKWHINAPPRLSSTDCDLIRGLCLFCRLLSCYRREPKFTFCLCCSERVFICFIVAELQWLLVEG